MEFVFNRTDCQNLRKSLRKEWIETNGLGGYASSSIVCCNTRKYHGLLAVELSSPPGRFVLLSALEESLLANDKEASISCRKHPDVYYPRGHEYLHEVQIGSVPTFIYRYGDVNIKREIIMLHKQNVTLIRYSLLCGESADACLSMPEAVRLRVKPLLAYRNMHALSASNIDLQVKTWPAKDGFSIRPYNAFPPFFMQANAPFTFHPSPDWYNNVEYMVEAERGFDNHEDLFQPGVMDIELKLGKSIILSASTEDVVEKLGSLQKLWDAEIKRRKVKKDKTPAVQKHLQQEGKRFLITDTMGGEAVVAGYHWFGAWGRDTCIALSGLTFAQGEHQAGLDVLERLAQESSEGRIPNMFSPDGNHAYNCIDASLWYAWAMQNAFESMPDGPKLLRKHCWKFIKTVIEKYSSNVVPYVHCDAEGFLHVGNEETQLTWMDANVHGKAVTPRHGCPVEINALWYNLLAFAQKAAKHYGEKYPHILCHQRSLDAMRKVFVERFWVENARGNYLADSWRPHDVDKSLRPNQLFAVGLPFAILDEEYWGDVVDTCRNNLLTPFGMRTLAPSDINYRSQCQGSPEERDGAYHQGTVWPWLLGIYGDALLRAAWDTESAVREFLEHIAPIFTTHLSEAGVGSVSEIFMADPPYKPGGCIAQAWSIAEVIRLLNEMGKAAPKALKAWEQTINI